MLGSNQLTGPIPPALGALGKLRSLLLHANELSGSIPSELGALHNLDTLALSGNQLTGPIPAELAALPRLDNLAFLHLSGNPGLSGCVPTVAARRPRRTTSTTWPSPTARPDLCPIPYLVPGQR